MKSSMKTLAALATALAIGGFVAQPAAAQDRTRVGTLNCDISGGLGLIIGSSKDSFQCLFNPSGSGPREAYVGTINKFGIDIGATAGGHMVWAVYAPELAPLRRTGG